MNIKKGLTKIAGWQRFLPMFIILVIMSACPDSPTNPKDENPYKQEPVDWPSLADSPWPMYRHDPQNTGRSEYLGPSTPNYFSWYSMIDISESSMAEGSDGNIYFADTKTLYAVDNNGANLWNYDLGCTDNNMTPIVNSGNRIFYVDRKGDLKVFDLDGTVLWQLSFNKPVSFYSMGYNGNLFVSTIIKLYKVSNDGQILFEVAETGKIEALSNQGEQIYLIHDRSGILIARDVNDGHKIWEKELPGKRLSYIVIDSNDNLFVRSVSDDQSQPSYLYSISKNGEENWIYTYHYPEAYKQYLEPFYPTIDWNGNIYFLATYQDSSWHGQLVSLSNDGKTRWILDNMLGICSLISDINNNVYGYIRDGDNIYFASVSAEGEINWKVNSKVSLANPYEPIIGSNRRIYIASSNYSISNIYVIGE